VEVAEVDNEICFRDGKVRDGAVLRFTRAEWVAFCDGVKTGDFDAV
jgi:hypothetical protein